MFPKLLTEWLSRETEIRSNLQILFYESDLTFVNRDREKPTDEEDKILEEVEKELEDSKLNKSKPQISNLTPDLSTQISQNISTIAIESDSEEDFCSLPINSPKIYNFPELTSKIMPKHILEKLSTNPKSKFELLKNSSLCDGKHKSLVVWKTSQTPISTGVDADYERSQQIACQNCLNKIYSKKYETYFSLMTAFSNNQLSFN